MHTAKHTTCLVCSSQKLNELAGYYAAHGLVKCGSCGFVFMDRVPSVEDLDKHYGQYSYNQERVLSQETIQSYETLLDELEPYRKNGRMLDVGCGRGWFLQRAQLRGWQVYGTEFSETAVELCEAGNIDMKLGKLNPASFNGLEFDVVTSFEVIEHINDPNEELARIHQLLRPGGLFYCTTPNFNSLNRYYQKAEFNIIEYPEHLSYYTTKTLHRVLRQNGFKKQKVLTTGVSITRIKLSKGDTSGGELDSAHSDDEKLRQKIGASPMLGIVKDMVNRLLTLTSSGITLKGYYVKP